MLIDPGYPGEYSEVTGRIIRGKESNTMLSETMICDAVDEAMKAYAEATGKNGLTKADLWKAVSMRGGNRDDLHKAMITGLMLLAPGDPVYTS